MVCKYFRMHVSFSENRCSFIEYLSIVEFQLLGLYWSFISFFLSHLCWKIYVKQASQTQYLKLHTLFLVHKDGSQETKVVFQKRKDIKLCFYPFSSTFDQIAPSQKWDLANGPRSLTKFSLKKGETFTFLALVCTVRQKTYTPSSLHFLGSLLS